MQKELLGDYTDAKNDPFRAIEFSDCAFSARNSQIVGVLKNISANQHTGEVFVGNSMQIQAEAIKGSLIGGEKGECLLRLNTDLMKANGGVVKSFGIKDIIRSCNYFFWREFNREYEKFYKEAEHCDLILLLHDELESCSESENQFMIRVGHWSQVEFVTFEENLRSPKTRVVLGKALPYGTTRTVFNFAGEYLPFGWCKCVVEERV